MQLLTLLVSVSIATVIHAQTIKVKLVNGKTGQPITGTCVTEFLDPQREPYFALLGEMYYLYIINKGIRLGTIHVFKEGSALLTKGRHPGSVPKAAPPASCGSSRVARDDAFNVVLFVKLPPQSCNTN